MRKYILYHLLFFIGFPVFSQQQDAVGTVSVQLEKKFSRSFSTTFYNLYGFNENLTELGYSLFDVGLNYKINDNWTIGGNYRLLAFRNLENSYTQRQFLYSDILWSKSKGDFSLFLRSRFLVKYYGLHFAEDENFRVNKHYLRNKATLKYDLNYSWSVFIATEQIYHLDQVDLTEQWRYSCGVNYRINTKNRIQYSYSISADVNKKHPDTNFISSLTYYYKF